MISLPVSSSWLQTLDKRYKQLISENFEQIKDEYISQLYRLNEWCNYQRSNWFLHGRIISVTDDGRLQIEIQDGQNQ